MSDVMEHYQDDGLHEECGVFGMYDFDGHDVARTIYYGLFALQHRGQESCGIAVSDTEGPKGKVLSSKGMGLVNEVFTQEDLDKLKGNIGVGHVRYSTAGASTRENAQPLVLNYIKGTLALAHNGNLVNAPELRRELAHDGAIFQTTIDSEVIAYHIARERVKTSSAEEAVQNAMKKLVGSYSLIVMSPRKLIGARDPFGFKPLCIGKRDNSYIITSETCALETIGAEFVRDVEPGEIIIIEIQNTRELYYLERILYGVAKAITEHIHLGDAYYKVKKIYSISVLYFDIGIGLDYLYHGQNQFIGVHSKDQLFINTKERDAIVSRLPSEIFPEYILIRVNEFNKVAVTPLEEWMDYLKDGTIRPDTTAPGLGEAREKLRYYSMTPSERNAYDEHLSAIMIQNDVLDSAKLEGRIEGLAEGREENNKANALKMNALGIEPEIIRQVTGLAPGEYD